MNCKCIENIEAKVLDKMQQDNAGKGNIKDAQMQNRGLSFDPDFGGWFTYQEIEYKLTPLKKDGTYGRKVTKKINIYHTYCPFCGTKIKSEKT